MADTSRQPPAASRQIRVEVVYALPGRQALIALEVEEGASVGAVIARSGIRERFPEVTLAHGVGVFGRPVSLDALVRDGDRVEIYRPLLVDPRQARRERAKKGGKAGAR